MKSVHSDSHYLFYDEQSETWIALCRLKKAAKNDENALKQYDAMPEQVRNIMLNDGGLLEIASFEALTGKIVYPLNGYVVNKEIRRYPARPGEEYHVVATSPSYDYSRACILRSKEEAQ